MRPTPLPPAADSLPTPLTLSLRRALALCWSAGGRLALVATAPDGHRRRLAPPGATTLAPAAWQTLAALAPGSLVDLVPATADLRRVLPGVWRSVDDDGRATDAFVALLDEAVTAATLDAPASGYGPDADLCPSGSAPPEDKRLVADLGLCCVGELGATIVAFHWDPVASAVPAITRPILTVALAAVTRAETEQALAQLGAAG